jgi:hypothetical protein
MAEPTRDQIAHDYALALVVIDGLRVLNAELLEAVRAGGRYSDALRRYQGHGVRGQMIPGTDELERLFMDWHDKGHAALDKAEGQS